MRRVDCQNERGLFVEGLIFFVFFVVVFAAVAVVTVSKQNEWRDELINSWNVQRPGNEFVAYWNIAGRWEEKTAAEIVPGLEAWRLSSQNLSMVGNRFDVCTFIARLTEAGGGLVIAADGAKRTASCADANNLVTNPVVRRKLESAYIFNADVDQVLFLVNAAFERASGEIHAAHIAETSARDFVDVPWLGCTGGACGPGTPTPTPTPTPPTPTPTATATATPTPIASPSLAVTVLPSITPSPTPVPSVTGLPTLVATLDATAVPTGSISPSATATSMPSVIATLDATIVPVVTASPQSSLPPAATPSLFFTPLPPKGTPSVASSPIASQAPSLGSSLPQASAGIIP